MRQPSVPARSICRRLAVVAAVLALASVPLGASAAQAPRQSSGSGWNDWSCAPSAAHPRPVVLVHGTFGNSVDNWLGLAPYLVKRGYCVFSLDYGQLPGRPFFHGLGPIEKSAEQLDEYVDKVLAATGAREVDLVGHSQGGMMPRQYLKFHGGADKVDKLVGIAPPNHGATLSGLTRLADQFPPIGDIADEIAPSLLQQKEGSAFLKKLNEGGDTVPGVSYTVITTRYDEVVTPYKSQFLDGPDVKNVLLQDLCPLNISEHVAIGLADRMAFHETANALDPEHATPTGCLS
ncbi:MULTISPECIES: esterase/lipase family protein [Streptomyces]|uniref:Lipase n=1 Tax=Streptomyces cacaoi TaxID=1898 RepID=A0A4Y3R5I8_STRCI|nr:MULTISPECIES: alpha/beta fold hydrolase [Streptomyces]NNG87398.1 alpha/beta fold hydrolase [Streptomyces cacaoi]QHF94222.1 lipase [Streptomyces sp. NHF165]GEB51200.1 lipase [Streptomyces cacaoi]